ncbi:MAG: OmpA family protein [Bacteroidales bacterium]|nr:OmpA family protein [Bacteroidales bacterium]
MKKIIPVLLFLSATAFSQDKKPTDKEALLKVTVTDFNSVPRKSEIIIFENLKTKESFTGISGNDGKFSILIPKGCKYNIKFKSYIDEIDYNTIEIPSGEGQITSNLFIKIEPPKTFTLRNVLFDFGKATLKKESFKTLNDLVELMKIKTTMVIEIAGHTDNVGGAESNMKLSQERANSVRDYLIKNGVPATRVTAKGYGDTQPVDDNATDEGRQKNRRTEVKILSE